MAAALRYVRSAAPATGVIENVEMQGGVRRRFESSLLKACGAGYAWETAAEDPAATMGGLTVRLRRWYLGVRQ
jgi:hypothetical protein